MRQIITCLDELQRLERRRVPRLFYDYVDSGSWTQATYRENSEDLARLHFRQRVGCNVEHITTRATILGQPLSLPLILAPTGLTGMVHPDSGVNPPYAPAYPVEWECPLRTLEVVNRVDAGKIDVLLKDTPFERVNDRVAFRFMLSPGHTLALHSGEMFDLMVPVAVRYS